MTDARARRLTDRCSLRRRGRPFTTRRDVPSRRGQLTLARDVRTRLFRAQELVGGPFRSSRPAHSRAIAVCSLVGSAVGLRELDLIRSVAYRSLESGWRGGKYAWTQKRHGGRLKMLKVATGLRGVGCQVREEAAPIGMGALETPTRRLPHEGFLRTRHRPRPARAWSDGVLPSCCRACIIRGR